MKALDTVFAWAMVVLGVLHAAFTFTLRPFGMGSVWFFSGGAAVIMAGLLNVSRIRRPDEFTRGTSIAANLMIVAITVAVMWFSRYRLGSKPQVLAVAVVSVGELLFSLRGGR